MLPSALAVLAFAASSLACSPGDELPAAPKNVALGQPFDLKTGEVGLVGSEGLEVGFHGVTSDSRCPENVNCVWEGEAALTVWTRHPKGTRSSHELRTTGKATEVTYLEYRVRLVKLAPQPRDGVALAAKDYRLTLVVEKK